MPEFLDILKLRVLLSFLNEDPRICTVTGLAGVLGEGKYRFPFLIYEEYVSGGTDLSMESAGFVHPCTLAEAGGVGTVCLHPVDASACSQMTGRGMNGRVRRLMYLDGDTFSPAYDDGSTISFPVLCRYEAHTGIHRHFYHPDPRAVREDNVKFFPPLSRLCDRKNGRLAAILTGFCGGPVLFVLRL